MSALDKAVTELEEKRAKEDAERSARVEAASALLREFYESDVATSEKLKAHGVHTTFDGKRILLEKPETGVYADGMMIVVGEQGEIDVNGRSLGPALGTDVHLKNELIAEIITHFDL